MPTTVSPGATACTTTALAPTRAPSPTVIAPRILAPAPTITPLPTRRVPLAALAAGAAQRDLVVEVDVIADLGGLADHHAHAVIDDQPAAEPGGRVDLDPGQPAADMGDEAGGQAEAAAPEAVGQPMPEDGMQPG